MSAASASLSRSTRSSGTFVGGRSATIWTPTAVETATSPGGDYAIRLDQDQAFGRRRELRKRVQALAAVVLCGGEGADRRGISPGEAAAFGER
jgi:hypothetical protein